MALVVRPRISANNLGIQEKPHKKINPSDAAEGEGGLKMPVHNSKRTTTKKEPASVSDLIVRRSKHKAKAAPMLTEDIAPAGRYRSEIIGVADAKSDADKLMVDVTYRLTDNHGKAVDARIRYPAEGYHIDRLFDALIDAGLPEESPVTEAVGIVEEVEIVYPFEGALGKIKVRTPVAASAPASKTKPKPKQRAALVEEDDGDDADDEFDDFLEDVDD